MALVLDAGALIAVDQNRREVLARIRVAQLRAVPVRSSAAVVAQVWRDGARQATLSRVLAGVDTYALDSSAARQVGKLLRSSYTSDVVDAHLASVVEEGDAVLTSDEGDMRRLLGIRAVTAAVISV